MCVESVAAVEATAVVAAVAVATAGPACSSVGGSVGVGIGSIPAIASMRLRIVLRSILSPFAYAEKRIIARHTVLQHAAAYAR